MKLKGTDLINRRRIQFGILLLVMANALLYQLYIEDYSSFRLLKPSDLNPYAGFVWLQQLLTDLDWQRAVNSISVGVGLTAALIVVSLIFGKLFCGWLCPVGCIQDVIKLNAISHGSNSNKFSNYRHFIKYIVLLIIVILPYYSGYGTWAFVSPWTTLQSLPGLFFVEFKFTFALLFFLLIIAISIFYFRPFCQYLCPLGAVQSMLNAVIPKSLLQTNRQTQSCNSCSACRIKCPQNLHVASKSEIYPDCNLCLQCCEQNNCDKKIGIFNKTFAPKRYVMLGIIVFIAIWFFTPVASEWAFNDNFDHLSAKNASSDKSKYLDGVFLGKGNGYGGEILLEVKIDDGIISNFTIISHNETVGFYEEPFKKFSNRVINNGNIEIQAVSGATKTVSALEQALQNALVKAQTSN